MKHSFKFLGLVLTLAFLSVAASCQKKTDQKPIVVTQTKVITRTIVVHPKPKKVEYKKQKPKAVKRRVDSSRLTRQKLAGWWTDGNGGRAIHFYVKGTYDYFNCSKGVLSPEEGAQGIPYAIIDGSRVSLSHPSVWNEAKGTLTVASTKAVFTMGVFKKVPSEAAAKSACS